MTALLTGVDDEIGRAMALAFAREGANIVLMYQPGHPAAALTHRQVEDQVGTCGALCGDPTDLPFYDHAVHACLERYGRLDVLVNHLTLRYGGAEVEGLTNERMAHDLRGAFAALQGMTRTALGHVQDHNAVVNTLAVVVRHETAERAGARTSREGGGDPAPGDFAWGGLAGAFSRAARVIALPAADMGTSVERAPVERGEEQVVLSYVFCASCDASLLGGKMIRPGFARE